ncbi:MAG: diguanylate cyclase [Proteobacteria bacterium]|nr:diguanylate cyclase [Pseudomonadota bacterium]
MRYREDRQQSAEILRLAVAAMGKQPAAANPTHYALWYEHCAGLNPGLSRVLEARLAAGSALTDEDVWQLHGEHIAAREHRQYENVRADLHRILKDTADETRKAEDQSSRIDEALANHQERLSSPADPAAVQQTVVDLLSDTGRMRSVAAELSARLQASTEEVNSLTQSLQRAQSEALRDPLTDLRNRRGFEQSAADLQMQRGNLEHIALLMIDIDHFKAVNDTHGHVLGDKVLRAVAHVLKSNIKGRDVAARVGGEEFAVLLPDTSVAGAVSLARQICALVSHGRIKRAAGEGTIGQVTLSIGVAVAGAGESLETLMERADGALYEAKRTGRARVNVAEGDRS